MRKEYLYHFTSVENLLKIVVSDRFMLNSIINMNDINESENIYDKNCIDKDDNKGIREYLIRKEMISEQKSNIEKNKKQINALGEFLKKNINNPDLIDEFENEFENLDMGKTIIENFSEECNNYTEEEFDEFTKNDILQNCIYEFIKDNEGNISLKECLINEQLYKSTILKEMVGKFIANIYVGCFNDSTNDEEVKKEYSLWAHYGKLNRGVAVKFCKRKLIEKFNEPFKETTYVFDEYEWKRHIIKIDKKINYDATDKELDKKLLNENILKYLIMHENLDGYKKDYFFNICEERGKYNFDKKEKADIEQQAIEEFKKEKNYFSDIDNGLKEMIEKIYFSKDKCWEYEKEYRLGAYIYKYDKKAIFINGINDAIEGVILGKKINEYDKYIIKKLGKKILGNNNFIIE